MWLKGDEKTNIVIRLDQIKKIHKKKGPEILVDYIENGNLVSETWMKITSEVAKSTMFLEAQARQKPLKRQREEDDAELRDVKRMKTMPNALGSEANRKYFDTILEQHIQDVAQIKKEIDEEFGRKPHVDWKEKEEQIKRDYEEYIEKQKRWMKNYFHEVGAFDERLRNVWIPTTEEIKLRGEIFKHNEQKISRIDQIEEEEREIQGEQSTILAREKQLSEKGEQLQEEFQTLQRKREQIKRKLHQEKSEKAKSLMILEKCDEVKAETEEIRQNTNSETKRSKILDICEYMFDGNCGNEIRAKQKNQQILLRKNNESSETKILFDYENLNLRFQINGGKEVTERNPTPEMMRNMLGLLTSE